MTPSRTRLEVRSQYNLKFDPGASTLNAPPPPWEAQRPPGVEMSSCLPAALVYLCCQALDCRHVYVHSFEGSIGCSSPMFPAVFLFSRFDYVWTTRPKHSRNRIDLDLRFTISMLFGHALGGKRTCPRWPRVVFVLLCTLCTTHSYAWYVVQQCMRLEVGSSYASAVLFSPMTRGEHSRFAASPTSAGPETFYILLIGELKRVPPHQSSTIHVVVFWCGLTSTTSR